MGITYEITLPSGERCMAPGWFSVQGAIQGVCVWDSTGTDGWNEDGSPRGWYLEAVDADTGKRHVIELTLQSGGRVSNGKFWRFVQARCPELWGDDDRPVIQVPVNKIPQPPQYAVVADLDGQWHRLAGGFMTRGHVDKWAKQLDQVPYEIREERT